MSAVDVQEKISDGIIRAEIPEVFDFLFQPARYKVCVGGRGKGASWNFARALIIYALKGTLRFLCTREVQNSIAASVYQVLSDQIMMMGAKDFFAIKDNSILCKNGSEFIFEGLFRNVDKIMSMEGINICWVAQGETISDRSWEILIPTIRGKSPILPKAEIWIDLNTKYADDPTYQRFVVKPPPDSIVKHINYDQNPFFPPVLEEERKTCLAYYPHDYKNIWLGEPIGYGRRVWQEFNEKVHVKHVDLSTIKAKANFFMSMDPAQHYYPACLWGAIWPKNEKKNTFYKHIYAEWPRVDTFGQPFHEVRKKILYTGSLSDMAKEIYVTDNAGLSGVVISRRGIDTRFAKGSGSGSYFSNSTLGIVSEFAKKENGGLVFDCPDEKLIDVQKNSIVEDMRYNTLNPLTAMNEPSFSVEPSCNNLIDSLRNHRLEEDSEKEAEKYKDFSDAMKILWAIMAEWKYVDPEAKKKTTTHTARVRLNSETGWMA